MSKKQPNRFGVFLTENSLSQLCSMLDVTVRTVSYWRSGEKSPNAVQIAKIVRASKSRVTATDIVDWSIRKEWERSNA